MPVWQDFFEKKKSERTAHQCKQGRTLYARATSTRNSHTQCPASATAITLSPASATDTPTSNPRTPSRASTASARRPVAPQLRHVLLRISLRSVTPLPTIVQHQQILDQRSAPGSVTSGCPPSLQKRCKTRTCGIDSTFTVSSRKRRLANTRLEPTSPRVKCVR